MINGQISVHVNLATADQDLSNLWLARQVRRSYIYEAEFGPLTLIRAPLIRISEAILTKTIKPDALKNSMFDPAVDQI